MKCTRLGIVFLLLSAVALGQVSGAQGAVASYRQNLPAQQVSFPIQNFPGGLDPNLAFVVLDSELVGGSPHLMLISPSGPFSFSLVCDLSLGCGGGGGVGGSGTAGTIPVWSTSSSLGNS